MAEVITEAAFELAVRKCRAEQPQRLQSNSSERQLIVGWDVPGSTFVVKVYSSVYGSPGGGGYVKDTGSIRVCLIDTATSVGIGKQSYIQPTRGWERRLVDRVGMAFLQAEEEIAFRRTCIVGPAPDCPACASKMVLRHAKKPNAIEKYAGVRFWGCSSFPACRKTLPFKPEPTPQAKAFRELAALRKQVAEWNP